MISVTNNHIQHIAGYRLPSRAPPMSVGVCGWVGCGWGVGSKGISSHATPKDVMLKLKMLWRGGRGGRISIPPQMATFAHLLHLLPLFYITAPRSDDAVMLHAFSRFRWHFVTVKRSPHYDTIINWIANRILLCHLYQSMKHWHHLPWIIFFVTSHGR